MELRLTVNDLATLGRQAKILPPIVKNVRGTAPTVEADVAIAEIQNPPTAIRFAAKVAPVVAVSATLRGFDAGIARIGIAVSARRLPLEKLVGMAMPILERKLSARGLPAGTVRRGDSSDEFLVDLASVVRTKGVELHDLRTEDGRFVVDFS
ncbi:hypothetical protein [Paraoerskovia marina]|uniref:Uncharacterized protein n=1 Tax=Paraoerskovia marina TaxID=545619 RepID=A0A1H1UJB9_9CELL|nr:hypothetical protein [Paraoerskovia marina]SDS72654.1 hypothetical protein SAMN04489860_2215 [Paraoerskovia marina]